MKPIVAAMPLLFAMSLYAMPVEEARHLVSRTHFGVTKPLLEQYVKMSHIEAVHYLLENTTDTAVTPPPRWVYRRFERPDSNSTSEEDLQKKRRIQRMMRRDLKLWWYGEMLATTSDLTEMMTLFWHNHFVSSLDKVKSPMLMYRQNVLLRHEAVGSYKKMLYAIIRDPAMLIYLDNTTNTKHSPNENLGRELLELFSMGEGSYSEDDVKNAARALTGYGIDRKTGSFRFKVRQHDYGVKEFLGQRGRFDGEDIVRIILEQDETALFITRKIWRYFVSDAPDEDEIRRLAAIFRSSDYRIKPLLEVMLNLESFKNSQNYGSLIKSPVEMTVGTLKSFEIYPKKLGLLVGINRRLQQDIFYPPNVKGWQGYKEWINTTTLLERRNTLEKAVLRMSFPAVVPTQNEVNRLQTLLLSTDPLTELQTNSYQSLYLSILLDPAYQLK